MKKQTPKQIQTETDKQFDWLLEELVSKSKALDWFYNRVNELNEEIIDIESMIWSLYKAKQKNKKNK